MTAAKAITLPFLYVFNTDGKLEETGKIEYSTSPYFWISSGGFLTIKGGLGMTNQGDLLSGKWHDAYLKSSPIDTDQGRHPQNIFRMPTRSKWVDLQQEISFTIRKTNLSSSPNRGASNGLFFMARYLDQNNLYYLGARVDGCAVIKKKYKGIYETLCYKKIWSGTYGSKTMPNLLPADMPIVLRAQVKNLSDGSVSLKLSRKNFDGTFSEIASASDPRPGLTTAGYAGIRTDFMDTEFDNYILSAV